MKNNWTRHLTATLTYKVTIMKAEGRKHYKSPVKRDCHPKNGYMNWWEDVCDLIPRATRKLLFKKEIGNITELK